MVASRHSAVAAHLGGGVETDIRSATCCDPEAEAGGNDEPTLPVTSSSKVIIRGASAAGQEPSVLSCAVSNLDNDADDFPIIDMATGQRGLPPSYWFYKREICHGLNTLRSFVCCLCITTVPLFVLYDAADPFSLVLNTVRPPAACPTPQPTTI